MRRREHGFVALLVALAVAAGCTSTREIETARPQPAAPAENPPAEAAPRSGVAVYFGIGETRLPEEVRALRFRVDVLRFKPAGGDWVSYPAAVNSFEIGPGTRPVGRALLTTQLPPARYDSVAVSLSNLYVEYGPGAGGPLAVTDDGGLVLPVSFTASPDRPAVLRLTLEPGASLSRSPDCRWFFAPFVRIATE